MPAEPAVAEVGGAIAPIVVDVVVPCPPDRAFDYFTRDIDRWWPLQSHSVGLADAASVTFEPHAGGALAETRRDGSRARWGTVSKWEPGRQLAFSWHPGRDETAATWVDVRFAATAAGTRVTLTHGGWERRDDGAAVRENYVGGWQFVFIERFGAHCAKR